MKQTIVMASFLLIIAAVSCGPKNIPGIGIELSDTPEHRALVMVVDKYRQAFENKDVDTLASLASSRFYEDAGSTDTEDDYNFDGLSKHFTEHFKHIDKCTLSIAFKDVEIDEDKATISYRFTARYLMNLTSGPKWRVLEDINQMEFVKENEQWKVVSGM